MSLNGHWVAMSETQPWKFFALQRLNFQSLKLNFQFLEGNFKISEPCVTEVQVREIGRKIDSLKRTAFAEAAIAVIGLSGAVHTAGWSLLAAALAIFQGYKTFESYRRETSLNPAYFLWRL